MVFTSAFFAESGVDDFKMGCQMLMARVEYPNESIIMTARRFIVLLATLAVAACTQSPEVNVLPPGGEEVVTIPQQRPVSTA